MFKSKARKEAERQLKVEQEKQRILAEQQLRLERQQLAQKKMQEDLERMGEDLKRAAKTFGRWFLSLSGRNKAIFSASVVVVLFGVTRCASPDNVAPTVTTTDTSTPAAIAPATPAPALVQSSPAPTPKATPSLVQASPTPVAQAPKPSTEEEQFKQVVLSNTDGLFAIERIQNMPDAELFAYRATLLEAVSYGTNGGVPLEFVKQTFADQLHMQHGMDEKLAYNLSNGLIEGTLAWERGDRPSDASSEERD